MQLSLPTLSLALATLVATAQGCLRMNGVITSDYQSIINVVDNGKTTCSYWGPLNGQPQGLGCIAGFSAWVQLQIGTGFTGRGTLAYANGGNNYRIPVGSTAHTKPDGGHYWEVFADSWC